jgi:hypothetical protein
MLVLKNAFHEILDFNCHLQIICVNNATIESNFENNRVKVQPSSLEVEDIQYMTGCEQDIQIGLPVKKSMKSMSRSTFDSVIDDFIEDDFEKASAFVVSVLVVSIFSTFMIFVLLALFISFRYQTGFQSKKIAFELCVKFPDWQFLLNSSSSWCDDRIFNQPFQLGQQCPCFASQLRPEVVEPLWPYTGIYGTSSGKY